MNTALSTAATATAGAGGAIRRSAATADALYSAYRAEYCAPAQYIPSTRMPANLTSKLFYALEVGESSQGKKKKLSRSTSTSSSFYLFFFVVNQNLAGPGFSLTFSLGNCSLAVNPGLLSFFF